MTRVMLLAEEAMNTRVPPLAPIAHSSQSGLQWMNKVTTIYYVSLLV